MIEKDEAYNKGYNVGYNDGYEVATKRWLYYIEEIQTAIEKLNKEMTYELFGDKKND